MRKLLIILLTITIGIVTSCISEYPEPTLSLHKDIPIVSESTTTPRSIEEALQIATEATALLSRDIDEVSISRRVPERTIDHTIPVYTVRKRHHVPRMKRHCYTSLIIQTTKDLQ